MPAERLRDRDEIERFLRRDAPAHVYGLADLDDARGDPGDGDVYSSMAPSTTRIRCCRPALTAVNETPRPVCW